MLPAIASHIARSEPSVSYCNFGVFFLSCLIAVLPSVPLGVRSLLSPEVDVYRLITFHDASNVSLCSHSAPSFSWSLCTTTPPTEDMGHCDIHPPWREHPVCISTRSDVDTPGSPPSIPCWIHLSKPLRKPSANYELSDRWYFKAEASS